MRDTYETSSRGTWKSSCSFLSMYRDKLTVYSIVRVVQSLDRVGDNRVPS
jgi:hypothetical protein